MTSPSSSCSFRGSSNFTVAVDVSTSVQCLQPSSPVYPIATTPLLSSAPPPPPPDRSPDDVGSAPVNFSVVVPQERVAGPAAEQRHGVSATGEDDVPYLRRKSKVDSKRKRSREESAEVKYGPVFGNEIRIQCEETAEALEEPTTNIPPQQMSDYNRISCFLPIDSRHLVVTTSDAKSSVTGSIPAARTSTSSFGGKMSLDVGVSPLVYDSTFSVDRRSVLEIPFDENNVPQIDRAATPPIFFRQSSLQVWPRSYTRRFASLRLQQRGSSQLQVPAGSLRAGKASGKSRSITLGGGHSSSVRTRLDHGLRINAFVSTDRLHRGVKDSLLQNIGDDVSLYGTPKEDITPFMSKSSTFGSPNYLREQIVSLFQPSDNKLAMKLFGNKHALMKEKMRQKAVGKWVIHPCSNFR